MADDIKRKKHIRPVIRKPTRQHNTPAIIKDEATGFMNEAVSISQFEIKNSNDKKVLFTIIGEKHDVFLHCCNNDNNDKGVGKKRNLIDNFTFCSDRLKLNDKCKILLEFGWEGPKLIGSNIIRDLCTSNKSEWTRECNPEGRIIGIDDRTKFFSNGRCDQTLLYDRDNMFCVLRQYDLEGCKRYINTTYLQPIDRFLKSTGKHANNALLTKFGENLKNEKIIVEQRIAELTKEHLLGGEFIHNLIHLLRQLWAYILDFTVLENVILTSDVNEYICVVGDAHLLNISKFLSGETCNTTDIKKLIDSNYIGCECIPREIIHVIS